MLMLSHLKRDLLELSQIAYSGQSFGDLARALLSTDSYRITALQRLRESAHRRKIPLVNHSLRVLQSTLFAIEIGKDVHLGEGVYFVHPWGIVIGGDASVGDRVTFMGNNTVGTAKDNGYPIIENDVVLGAGARILGPITIGARSVIGANAVVLCDVPPDSVAVGVPAKIRAKEK